MKIKHRIKLFNHSLYICFDKIETLSGITSQIKFNRHIIMWDFDNTNKRSVYESLKEIQNKYDLSDIYAFTDNNKSFRAICFKIVDLITLLRIIIETEGVDMGFIKYTASRSKATIRLSVKTGRFKQEIAFMLTSYHVKIPKNLEIVIYDTPLTMK